MESTTLLGKLESLNKETLGFKSRKFLQTTDALIGFEDDLVSMIKNIEFRNASNTFQEQLASDIRSTNKVRVEFQQSNCSSRQNP